MKMGGGNYDEEAIEQAVEMARIVGTLMQGRVPEAKPIPVADFVVQPPVEKLLESARPSLVPIVEKCSPTTHQWERPVFEVGMTFAKCQRCSLIISSSKEDAAEAMADLLRQIPH